MRILAAILIAATSVWFLSTAAQATDEASDMPASNLAENAWDFTDPNGVPGFGPITEADVQRLLNLQTGDRD